MIEIMKAKGINRYDKRHVGNDSLKRNGLLPLVFSPPAQLVQQCMAHLEALEE